MAEYGEVWRRLLLASLPQGRSPITTAALAPRRDRVGCDVPGPGATPCGFLLRCHSWAVDRSRSAVDSSSRLSEWPCLLYADTSSCGSRCHPKLPFMVLITQVRTCPSLCTLRCRPAIPVPPKTTSPLAACPALPPNRATTV